MKLIIVYGDNDLITKYIRVIESDDIKFRFEKFEVNNYPFKEKYLQDYLVVEFNEVSIKLKIQEWFFDIRDTEQVKKLIEIKLSSNKELKFIVGDYCSEDTLAKII